MGNCSECGKKLRFWKGYRHPILGKTYLLCSNCYDLIDKSLEFYNKRLFEGTGNHKKECYFWDSEKNRCRNEEYFKNINKKKGEKSEELNFTKIRKRITH